MFPSLLGILLRDGETTGRELTPEALPAGAAPAVSPHVGSAARRGPPTPGGPLASERPQGLGPCQPPSSGLRGPRRTWLPLTCAQVTLLTACEGPLSRGHAFGTLYLTEWSQQMVFRGSGRWGDRICASLHAILSTSSKRSISSCVRFPHSEGLRGSPAVIAASPQHERLLQFTREPVRRNTRSPAF